MWDPLAAEDEGRLNAKERWEEKEWTRRREAEKSGR